MSGGYEPTKYFTEPPAWIPATASGIQQFAFAWSNDLRPHAAPPVGDFVRFPLCPQVREFGNPGEAYYQDGDKCSLGHHYAVFVWERTDLFQFRRLLHVYANAKLQQSPTYDPELPPSDLNIYIGGTFSRVWLCHQNIWGEWELTTGVMSEPLAVLSGEQVTGVELAVGRLGLHLDDDEDLGTNEEIDEPTPDTSFAGIKTVDIWRRFGLDYQFNEDENIGQPWPLRPLEYGNSKFVAPDTQQLKRYLWGTGEVLPA
jgi:hypothetical protein